LKSILLFLILLIPILTYGQYERIITYPNGSTEYIINFENDVVEKTICLSPYGDTIYSWDISKCVFIDYPLTGTYLTAKEYSAFKQQLFAKHHIPYRDSATALLSLTPPSPAVSEWKMMHDHFFKKCGVYTMIIREGEFTIVTTYERNVQQGSFKKYDNGLLVVSGQYTNGERSGLWAFHPYAFFPYDDIEIVNIMGKDFSLLYAILPALILISILIIAGRYAIKTDRYHIYFYIVALLAVIALLLRLYIKYDRQNIWIKEIVPATWFTLWHSMITLAVINLFFSRRTKPPVIVNMICLLVGLAFSIFVIFFKYISF
jgi:hypothetical protein